MPCVTSQREENEEEKVKDGCWMFPTNRVEAHIRIETETLN